MGVYDTRLVGFGMFEYLFPKLELKTNLAFFNSQFLAGLTLLTLLIGLSYFTYQSFKIAKSYFKVSFRGVDTRSSSRYLI